MTRLPNNCGNRIAAVIVTVFCGMMAYSPLLVTMVERWCGYKSPTVPGSISPDNCSALCFPGGNTLRKTHNWQHRIIKKHHHNIPTSITITSFYTDVGPSASFLILIIHKRYRSRNVELSRKKRRLKEGKL
jgi:hypothetical protein